jgi:hypothetical protein
VAVPFATAVPPLVVGRGPVLASLAPVHTTFAWFVIGANAVAGAWALAAARVK